MDSKTLLRETRILTEDEIIDISITRVEKSLKIPHGVKYSFNYRVRASSSRWRSVIRVDNAHCIKDIKKGTINTSLTASQLNLNLYP